MFESQPYMSFGVSTDADFKTRKDGVKVDNLYAAGAVLSGFNAMKEGSGAGISILSALHVSSLILDRHE
jgi:glycerol-3-phosphate dehydrogenase subunit B